MEERLVKRLTDYVDRRFSNVDVKITEMDVKITEMDIKISDMDVKMRGMDVALRQMIGEARDDASQKSERVETALLTEFHKWATPLESRVRTHRMSIETIEAEIDLLKDRVKKLENRPN